MKVLLIVAYSGQNYYGFQRQSSPIVPTIQDALEKVLSKVYHFEIKIKASGRTDRGVHAEEQVITFDDENDFTYKLKVSKLAGILNNYLPHDIRVRKAYVTTADFHPRYDGRVRWYRYEMQLFEWVSGFQKGVMKNDFFNLTPIYLPVKGEQEMVEGMRERVTPRRIMGEENYYLNYKELAVLQSLFNLFLGEHDFTAFASGKDLAKNKRRHMYAIEVVVRENSCRIDLFANAFLREMVRSLVGNVFYFFKLYLLGAKSDGEVLAELTEVLALRDPRCANHRVPPEGLTLKKIFYQSIFGKID